MNKLTLFYQGKLHANGSKKEKHRIRKVFHKQLTEYLKQERLIKWLEKEHGKPDDKGNKLPWWNRFKYDIGDFQFVPLINNKMLLIGEIDIFMLRPEYPGNIINQTGDIDNRLKTLFDALQIPKEDQIKKEKPEHDEKPFYCLFEDDNLITGISVKTDKLLEPTNDKSFVNLYIQVTIVKTAAVYANAIFW